MNPSEQISLAMHLTKRKLINPITNYQDAFPRA
jgi:hypothetical protein